MGNLPALQEAANITTQLQVITTQLEVITNQLSTLQKNVATLQKNVAILQTDLDQDRQMLPVRLYNSRCPPDSTLRFPANINSTDIPQFRARDELMRLSGVQCDAVLATLGLLPPSQATVPVRRQTIASYLGVLI